jgi:hypothetical protein
MSDELVTDVTLRQFLLGNVDDQTRQHVECRFITNSLFKERVLALEQDLIEDLLEDSLTANDKERLLAHYSGSPARRRKLRIAKSIKDWAMLEGNMAQLLGVFFARIIPTCQTQRPKRREPAADRV